MKKENSTNINPNIMGMIMLSDEKSFDLDAFTKDYNSVNENKITEREGDSSAVSFKILNDTFAIGHMPVPVPSAEIQGAAQYSYNWPDVLEDIKDHKSHLIVIAFSGDSGIVDRYLAFTKVASSVLRVTDSIGVYIGKQSLLIPKIDYLSVAAESNEDHLPVWLWVYIGLRKDELGNSGYTYGLAEFGKLEIEVLGSRKRLSEIQEFLYDIVHYLIYYDIAFNDGETCGSSNEEKVLITLTDGKYVEGKVFRLAY